LSRAVRCPFEDIFRVPCILHRHLHVLNHCVCVRARGQRLCFLHMFVGGSADRFRRWTLLLAGPKREQEQESPLSDSSSAVSYVLPPNLACPGIPPIDAFYVLETYRSIPAKSVPTFAFSRVIDCDNFGETRA
jgi:hypothetical protein